MRLLALAILSVGLLLGACGSDVERRNAYVAEVNDARAEFDRRIAEVTGQLRETSTSARTRAALSELQAIAARFEARLRAIRPPAVVADEHARLITQVARYGVGFERARDAFRTEDPNRYLSARDELQADVAETGRQLNAGIEALNTRLRQ